MDQRFQRTARILGPEAVERLSKCRVLLFGVGGVGGYAMEALARSGVGAIDIVDNDEIHISNINRQILATEATLGRPKVEVAAERLLAINPTIRTKAFPLFYLPCMGDELDFSGYNYVIDAIDTVAAKLDIISRCHASDTPVISAMGCGNRMDPSRLTISDISKTTTDPLARVIRKEMRKRNLTKLKVVWSDEPPIRPVDEKRSGGPSVPGSTAFVPPAAGLLLASEVVRDLLQHTCCHQDQRESQD